MTCDAKGYFVVLSGSVMAHCVHFVPRMVPRAPRWLANEVAKPPPRLPGHCCQRRKRTRAHAATGRFDDDLEPLEGRDMDEQSTMAAAVAAEKELLDKYGLTVNSLFIRPDGRDYPQDEWTDGPLDDDKLGIGSVTDSMEGFEDDYGDDDKGDAGQANREKSEAQKRFEEELEFQFAGRQQFQLEQVYDKAFELHHAQMERSVNPYATTNFYSKVLEDIDNIDATLSTETSPIPTWARAMFVLEGTFDEFNESVRASLEKLGERTSDVIDAAMLKEYEQSVAELAGDFDYNILRKLRPAAQLKMEEEQDEDISGVGDNLDAMLNVLPGLEAQVESSAYASDILGPVDDDDQGEEMFFDDADDEEGSNIDF
eukprot:TRINITY_DN13705_c0_g1_i3.p1 TRINITY_DN13705_c0_g1~~TRINITY_DN13705_c0_g1_i3.p1  ORF type:complete len:370 (-),score=69.52 TRINITY_DN13705_c0_g1_i3:744-1853(-)